MSSVLAPVDFSDVTPAVVQVAGAMARSLGGKLYLIHIDATDSIDIGYDLEAAVGRDELAGLLREEHSWLLELEEQARADGADARVLLRRGEIVPEIVREARRLDPRLIVAGSHGRGALHHLLLGSVSTGLLRAALCPVLIVPARVYARQPKPPDQSTTQP